MEFAERVSQLRENGLTLRHTKEAAVNLWEVSLEDLPLLRLAIQLVAASRQVMSFNILEVIQRRLLEGGSVPDLLQSLIETLVIVVCRGLLTLTLFTI